MQAQPAKGSCGVRGRIAQRLALDVPNSPDATTLIVRHQLHPRRETENGGITARSTAPSQS